MTTKTLPLPAADDRLLLIHDVRALMPKAEDGSCAVTDDWIRAHVAHGQTTRVGRQWAVRKSVFVAWHTRWVAGRLSDEEKPRARPKGGKSRAA